jgi:competence protein ComEC
VLLVARWIGPRIAVIAAAVALGAFVVVVQPTASVLRAAVMGAIALLAILTARRRQAVPALAGTVLLLMVLAPQLAVDVGFALSVSATAALVVIAPVWSRRLVDRGWPKPLADAVCLAAAAQLVTAPLIAGLSGSVSVVAVAANLVVAPVVAPVTVLGTAAATLSVCWAGAAELLIRFSGPELWWVSSVTRWAAATPGATVAVPVGVPGVMVVVAAGIVAGLIWRTRWRRAAIGATLICVLAWSIADVSGVRGTIVG